MKIETVLGLGRVTLETTASPFVEAVVRLVLDLCIEEEDGELVVDGKRFTPRSDLSGKDVLELLNAIASISPLTAGEAEFVRYAFPELREMVRQGMAKRTGRAFSPRRDNGERSERMSHAATEAALVAEEEDALTDALRSEVDDLEAEEPVPPVPLRAARPNVRKLGEARPVPPAPPERVQRFPGQSLHRSRVKETIRRMRPRTTE